MVMQKELLLLLTSLKENYDHTLERQYKCRTGG
jgi:hypothetical protein